MSEEYRSGAHTVFRIHLHLVWVTKYRKPALTGIIGTRCRELIREVCAQNDVTIIKGHVSRDHIHLFVSVPPKLAISKLMQYLKGKTSFKMMHEFPPLAKKFWGRHLWARGYFCVSSGNVTDEVIKEYIANQQHEGDEDFKVEGDDG